MTSIQEFNCVFCKETFNTKEALQIHFRKHGDPKFNQSLKNKNRFQNDTQVPGEKASENNEMINCDVCSEMFPTISKAITHKHKVHPDHDAKYFCPWCGKLFTMKHLYNKHLETTHDFTEKRGDNIFHCDCCDVDFFLPSAMLYHNRFFHRQDSELPAIGQSKKQKLFSQELLQIYYCAFCGEEYNNKVNLHKHMGDEHSDENQSPDDVLRCPLCEAIFFHLDAYELHLTFHSSKDVYSEKNEMNTNEISEFSLETVPPIMEKVENYEPPADAETTLNAMGIENFLQIAMDEPIDTDNQNIEMASEKMKSKKHKKHKKSKKSAITLDEFLNMNKDVFGEGLDIQGIEEVPTRVVKKQLKNKKQLQKQNAEAKLLSSSELDKLKQQGIVVKVKSAKTPLLHGIKIGSKIPTGKPIKIANSSKTTKIRPAVDPKQNTITTSEDVLSKLINQSNNQIKIIKKPVQENTNVKQKIDQLPVESSNMIKTPDQDFTTTKIIKTKHESKETDENMTSEIEENDENEVNEAKKGENLTIAANNDEESIDTKIEPNSNELNVQELHQEPLIKLKSSSPIENNKESSKLWDDKDNVDNDNNNKDKNIRVLEKTYHSEKSVDITNNSTVTDKNILGSLNAVRNINQHVTKNLDNDDQDKQKSEEFCEKQTTARSFENKDNNIDDDINEEKTIRKNNSISEEENIKSTQKSLIALKRLSHVLTIKPMNQTKNNILPVNDAQSKEDLHQETINDSDTVKNISDQCNIKLSQLTSPKQHNKNQNKSVFSNTPLNALKNLSKHITIKSLSQPTQIPKDNFDHYSSDENDEEEHDYNEDDAKHLTINKLETNSFTGNKVYSSLKTQISDQIVPANAKNPLKNISTDVIVQSSRHSPKTVLKPVTEKQYDNMSSSNNKDIKQQTNTDLLKHIQMANAKPATFVKNINQQVTVKSSQSMNTRKGNITQKCIKQEEVREDIEIFSIDDSDSDETENQNSKISNSAIHNNKNVKTKTPIKTLNVLKNMGKHITIKSTNPMNTDISNAEEILHDETNEISMDCDDFVQGEKLKYQRLIEKKNIDLKHKLKNLSKHITVTSRNSSPSLSVTSQDQNTQDSNVTNRINDVESDSDSYSSKIKITELNEDDLSDDDIPLKNITMPVNCHISKGEIQSGNESYSDNDYKDEELSDVESQIRLNTSKKPVHTLNPNKVSLKNIHKDMKVKVTNEKKINSEEECKRDNISQKEITEAPNNLSKTLSMKPYTKMKIVNQDDNDVRKSKITRQVVAQSNQSMADHNISTSNQTNSVNTQTTVKTFQTKTVIEEITTTVTKTVRTVNQTVQKEIRNNIQSPSTSTITPQKVIGMMSPSQPIRNYQGITVRHLSPTTKPKTTGMPIRPVVGTTVKPSNQLIPARPGLNVLRCPAPRMPIIKKKLPASQQKSVISKPLKISPNVITSSTKRTASGECSGPFSCFKKPKESLIPESDVSTFSGEHEGESSVNFASSHTSKSNYSSSTKIVKSNAVLTSTQVKSEICATSQQQLSRLHNVSGLKIIKTNQAKQYEERSEFNIPKRTTLETIEKLQKQGLLVKKPRLNMDTESDHSKSEDDNNDDDEHHDVVTDENDE